MSLYIIPLLLLLGSGCIESSTLVSVNPDGSGTITVREYFSPQVTTMLSGMGEMVEGMGENMQMVVGGEVEDPGAISKAIQDLNAVFKDTMESRASSLGPDVVLTGSSERTNSRGWKGFQAVYSFPDINGVALSLGSSDMGNAGTASPEEEEAYRFEFTPGDPAMLKVIPAGEPDAGKAEVDFEEVPNQATQAFETMGADALAAMLQPALTGMRMSIFLKVNGELLETNSRFTSEKNPNVITVMDMPVDRMFSNAEAMKVLASQDPGAVHKLQDLDIPGVKLEAQDKIITLRFRE